MLGKRIWVGKNHAVIAGHLSDGVAIFFLSYRTAGAQR